MERGELARAEEVVGRGGEVHVQREMSDAAGYRQAGLAVRDECTRLNARGEIDKSTSANTTIQPRPTSHRHRNSHFDTYLIALAIASMLLGHDFPGPRSSSRSTVASQPTPARTRATTEPRSLNMQNYLAHPLQLDQEQPSNKWDQRWQTRKAIKKTDWSVQAARAPPLGGEKGN